MAVELERRPFPVAATTGDRKMRELPEELLDAIATLPLPMRKQYAAARFAHHWTAEKYEARMKKAMAMLRVHEWRDNRCPQCAFDKPNHRPNCILAEILKENEQ
jgi:hypothetical protein